MYKSSNKISRLISDVKIKVKEEDLGYKCPACFESLPKDLEATHRSLFDGSLQGVHHKQYPVFGFQGHPEASPGPHDLRLLFNHFIELMEKKKL